MKELADIMQAYTAASRAGKQTALATVVHVQGSSYRRPGARMLITEDGHLTGAISGGCLEGDALRKAQQAMSQQKPMLVKYDTTDEDDAQLGIGLGCNGIIHILIEPLNSSGALPVQLFTRLLARRQQAVLVTVFAPGQRSYPHPGTCLLYTADGTWHGGLDDQALQNALLSGAQQVLERQASVTQTYVAAGHRLTAFIELVQPVVSLVVAGAGNDAMPLVQIARILGWEVTVVDGRPRYASAERFPSANRVLVAKPEQVLPQIQTDAQTVFVLMTHNYRYDLGMLQQLAAIQPGYIGVLGPRQKLQRMLNELEEQGTRFSRTGQAALYGPVGLDIGAETAEEIALAVIAEIKAVLAGRQAGSLRSHTTFIHSRSEQVITEISLDAAG
jgi:xanthine/CO dehydrogenase XdhC/CoxF family maturation factor